MTKADDEDDFVRAWMTNEDSTKVRTGLTAAETAEYQHLRALKMKGEKIDGGRFLELHQKHDRARLQRVALELGLRDGTRH